MEMSIGITDYVKYDASKVLRLQQYIKKLYLNVKILIKEIIKVQERVL